MSLVKKKTGYVGIRLPRDVIVAIERERQRVSRAAGAEVSKTAVIRAALEQRFLRRGARAA